MKNKIEDMRNLLFDQLQKLKDCEEKELDIEIQRSSSMVQMAETIIDSARAENEFLALVNGTGSGFIPLNTDERKKLPV